MKYSKIYGHDVVNGPGFRTAVFVQGCPIHCPGCFNKETWDPNGGKEWTENTVETILQLCDNQHISGLSILGGEPLAWYNKDAVLDLCKRFKERFADKTIWVWTGYCISEATDPELLKYVDCFVSGPFVKELKDTTIAYRGSRNQIIFENHDGTLVNANDKYDSTNSQ